MLGATVGADHVPDLGQLLTQPPGGNASEAVARREFELVLNTAGVFEIYGPGRRLEVGHMGVLVPLNPRPRTRRSVVRLSHLSPQRISGSRPIITLKRDPKHDLFRPGFLGRKLGP